MRCLCLGRLSEHRQRERQRGAGKHERGVPDAGHQGQDADLHVPNMVINTASGQPTLRGRRQRGLQDFRLHFACIVSCSLRNVLRYGK